MMMAIRLNVTPAATSFGITIPSGDSKVSNSAAAEFIVASASLGMVVPIQFRAELNRFEKRVNSTATHSDSKSFKAKYIRATEAKPTAEIAIIRRIFVFLDTF
jgi:hypothetical protein